MKPIETHLVSLLILFSCMAYGQVNFEPDSIFNYKMTKEGDLKMKVFKPSGHNISDKSPVIIFFFGGGWTSGNTKQFYQQARFFCR